MQTTFRENMGRLSRADKSYIKFKIYNESAKAKGFQNRKYFRLLSSHRSGAMIVVRNQLSRLQQYNDLIALKDKSKKNHSLSSHFSLFLPFLFILFVVTSPFFFAWLLTTFTYFLADIISVFFAIFRILVGFFPKEWFCFFLIL